MRVGPVHNPLSFLDFRRPAAELLCVIDLARLVDEAAQEELPEVAAALELARVKLQLRLVAPAPAARTDEDRLVDMEEVARVLGVPVAHARELGRRGELPVVHVGRYVRVRAGALVEWMALRENGRIRATRRA